MYVTPAKCFLTSSWKALQCIPGLAKHGAHLVTDSHEHLVTSATLYLQDEPEGYSPLKTSHLQLVIATSRHGSTANRGEHAVEEI